MDIYNYKKIEKCFVCGNIDKNIDLFIEKVTNKLKNYKKAEHPKEIERKKRLEAKMLERGHNVDEENGRQMGRWLRNAQISLSKAKKEAYNGNSQYNDSVIIVCGNCGIGIKSKAYFDEKFEALNKVLHENNCHILFIRGNNDNPSLFNENRIDFENIKTLQDYSVIQFKNFNALCIGGSVSIDKEWKILQENRGGKKSYWDDEMPVFNEELIDKIVEQFNISCVFTSTCPSFVSPGTNFYSHNKWVMDKHELLDEFVKERRTMDKIYDALINNDNKPYIWAYGRFNMGNLSTINDISFISLSRYEFTNVNEVICMKYGIDTSKEFGKNTFSIDGNNDYNKKSANKVSAYRFEGIPRVDVRMNYPIGGHLEEPVDPFNDPNPFGDEIEADNLDEEFLDETENEVGDEPMVEINVPNNVGGIFVRNE